MFAGTYVEPEASQYLLCQSWVPKPRNRPSVNSYGDGYRNTRLGAEWVPQPWDWYKFPVWQSIGQAPATEYIAERAHDESSGDP